MTLEKYPSFLLFLGQSRRVVTMTPYLGRHDHYLDYMITWRTQGNSSGAYINVVESVGMELISSD